MGQNFFGYNRLTFDRAGEQHCLGLFCTYAKWPGLCPIIIIRINEIYLELLSNAFLKAEMIFCDTVYG